MEFAKCAFALVEKDELKVKISDVPQGGLPLMRFSQHFTTCHEYEKALRHLDRSREILESVGNSASLGKVLGCMGKACFELDDLVKARTALQQTVEAYGETTPFSRTISTKCTASDSRRFVPDWGTSTPWDATFP